jgi:TolB-like protein/tetratricopeptide (TPR) repeat protein
MSWPTLGAALVAALALSNGGDSRGRPWPGPAAAPIQSLAVLPLANLLADTVHAWYADGLTEALITDLGRLSSLRVISRGSVMPFRGSTEPVREIARALEVDAIVEGGVQQSGSLVRVDVRVIQAATGDQLWAGRFEEPVQNRFALEDRTARGIISGLALSLSAPEARTLRAPPTTNLAAYESYLRAKIRLRHESREADSVAITLLERAVALDPAFAVGYAELAHAYGLRVSQFAPQDTEALERAGVAIERAARLDPDLAEVHWVKAQLLWGATRRWAAELAIQEDRRATQLDPNLAEAHHHLGMIYLHIGLLDSAIAEFRKTLTLDPSEGFAQQRIGIALVYQGRYQEGLRIFREVPPPFNPALWHYQVAWALLYVGRDAEAGALIEQYLRDHPEDRGGVATGARAILFAKRGDARRAEADIETAVQKGAGFAHFHHTAYSIAMAYALLHRPGPAVRYLRQAVAEGLPCYPCFVNDPYLATLRNDPDFIAVMRELKTQWERYRAL